MRVLTFTKSKKVNSQITIANLVNNRMMGGAAL